MAPKATIIATMEMNNVISPMMSLRGSDSRKSSSAQRDVRIPKNMNTAVEEENNPTASAAAKTKKERLLFVPYENFIAAENIVVMIRDATIEHADAVFLIHNPPLSTNSLCASLKTMCGVFPLLLIFSL